MEEMKFQQFFFMIVAQVSGKSNSSDHLVELEKKLGRSMRLQVLKV